MGQIRSLVPRQFMDWHGKFMFEGDPERRWRDCRVLDLSSAGAGLELPRTAPGGTLGTRIPLAVHLRGELRNTAPAQSNALRAGMQFVELTDHERANLELLEELQSTW